MMISYSVDGRSILNAIKIDFSKSKTILICGSECLAYNTLSGILGGLFPFKESIDIPILKDLIGDFTGKLEISGGEIPDNITYIGSDPERHLLFSKVDEEISAQLKINRRDANKLSDVLTIFQLQSTFLNRTISSLSGGEKMKIALSIGFSRESNWYVIHGVIPWLDKGGRESLKAEIDRVIRKGSTVVILEHEYFLFKELNPAIFYFDGLRINEISNWGDLKEYVGLQEKKSKSLSELSKKILAKKNDSTLLSLSKITYSNKDGEDLSILNNISCELKQNHVYVLIGNNGSGKSLLAKLIFRVIQPDIGSIDFMELPIKKYIRKELMNTMCYVGQFPEQQLPFSNLNNYHETITKNSSGFVEPYFNKYICHESDYPITSLSILELKLLCLFSFITDKTKLIILDEPTWGVDAEGQILFWNILNELAQHIDFTLFIISHDLSIIRPLNTKLLWLNDGKLRIYESCTAFEGDVEAEKCFSYSELLTD